MWTTEMARLFEASGPFLSLYLNSRGDVENAGAGVELRWKNGRSELLDRGVPEQLLEAVDPLVAGSQAGGATLAVVASIDGVLWSGSLPKPPPRNAGALGSAAVGRPAARALPVAGAARRRAGLPCRRRAGGAHGGRRG